MKLVLVFALLLLASSRVQGVVRTLTEHEAAHGVHVTYAQADFWKMEVKPACVGPIVDLTEGGKTSGAFDDGSKTDEFYAPNMDRCWNIPAPGAKEIKFVRLAVERGYDFVRIYTLEGNQAKFLKDLSPGDIIKTDLPVQVHMHSDHSVQDYGFDATWNMVNAPLPVRPTHTNPTGPLKVTIDVDHTETMTVHKTNKYKNDGTMLVRRGVPFKFTVNGAGDTPAITSVVLKLLRGEKLTIPVTNGPDNGKISAKVSGKTVVVSIPANGPVGEYQLGVTINKQEFWDDANVCVFFNPYNAADDTFVAQADWLAEYVENSQGAVWTANSPKPWDFAQFESLMYHATFAMIADLSITDRCSAVLVVRRLSAIVNSNNGGVLEGRWSSSFDGGKAPWSWEGSLDIVRQWYQSDGKSVKYGQCWVFAGVLTSTCRAIGIATRSVTNLNSAHEAKPFDQVVLARWTKSGDKWLKDDTDDSVWNFHVWNEVWMKRPDLSARPDAAGWQSIDATPQEVSGGEMQCGPASINLMQKNILNEQFDADFIKGEINSLQTTEVRDNANSPYRFYSNDTNAIGTALWTKARGRRIVGEDVKAAYKSIIGRRGSLLEEGSPARLRIFGPNGPKITVPEDFKVELIVSLPGVTAPTLLEVESEGVIDEDSSVPRKEKVVPTKGGKAIEIGKVKMPGAYQVSIDCHAITYYGKKVTGGSGSLLTSYSGALSKTGSVTIDVPFDKYRKFLKDTLSFECAASVHQPHSKEPACLQSARTTIDVLDIQIETPNPTLAVSDYLPIKLRWTNPLDMPIVNPTLRVQVSASGIDHSNFKEVETIGAKKTVHWLVELKSSVVGTNQISITLESKELYGITGTGFVTVTMPTQAPKNIQQSIERRSTSPTAWYTRFGTEVRRELDEMSSFLRGKVKALTSLFNKKGVPLTGRAEQQLPPLRKALRQTGNFVKGRVQALGNFFRNLGGGGNASEQQNRQEQQVLTQNPSNTKKRM